MSGKRKVYELHCLAKFRFLYVSSKVFVLSSFSFQHRRSVECAIHIFSWTLWMLRKRLVFLYIFLKKLKNIGIFLHVFFNAFEITVNWEWFATVFKGTKNNGHKWKILFVIDFFTMQRVCENHVPRGKHTSYACRTFTLDMYVV